MKCLYLVFLIVFLSVNAYVSENITSGKFDLWTKDGYHKLDWYDMSQEQKAFALERYKSNIEYSLQNIGKKFSEVEMSMVGSDKGYKNIAPFVTYGLIAFKYQDDYNDSSKAAEYFYKDWLNYKRCKEKREKQKKWEGWDKCWPGGPGDYNPLGAAIYQWKEAGMYNEALKHYQEYFDASYLYEPSRGIRAERVKFFKKKMKHNPELKADYEEFMKEWEEAKKLAKTEKPKPLDPAVQNHEWFYSEKREEVLKALEYYYANKVDFMLEKALAHKDKVVADKAREYLDKVKAEENSKQANLKEGNKQVPEKQEQGK